MNNFQNPIQYARQNFSKKISSKVIQKLTKHNQDKQPNPRDNSKTWLEIKDERFDWTSFYSKRKHACSIPFCFTLVSDQHLKSSKDVH